LWEGIQLAGQMEKEFDFEGSMHPGIAHFFSGFGGEIFTYFQVRKAGKMYGLYQNIKP
ncbi:MAG: methicillin resistance protein, partial [Cryomorphaceae bacterium]